MYKLNECIRFLNITLNIVSNELPPSVPNLYSPSASSWRVSNGGLYLSTARNAMRFPLYVATITIQNNHQNPTNILLDGVRNGIYPPAKKM